MSTRSNITMCYEEIVGGIAEVALDKLKDLEESEAIDEAINDQLIYYNDQAYVVAQYINSGYGYWGKDISWDEVYEMLYNDVIEEIANLKGEK